jgi:hypothetical protein
VGGTIGRERSGNIRSVFVSKERIHLTLQVNVNGQRRRGVWVNCPPRDPYRAILKGGRIDYSEWCPPRQPVRRGNRGRRLIQFLTH